MSRRRTHDLLHDLLDATERIKDYCSGMDEAAFVADRKTQDAVIRNLEIIGEIAGRLPEHVAREAPDIPWALMKGLRNRMIHAYFGVDISIVWKVVTAELPALEVSIQHLIDYLPQDQ